MTRPDPTLGEVIDEAFTLVFEADPRTYVPEDPDDRDDYEQIQEEWSS